MPLSDSLTKLDDRSYDTILSEMRARIARYTPEWKPVWTDVNDSDPGITMLQVAAWLAEMLTYRMNKVPELNYIKFLQLLGIELRPAGPAYAEITFPVKSTHSERTLIVPTRTMIMTEAADGGAPIIFETAESMTCLRASLASVLTYDGSVYTKVTDLNAAVSDFKPFGPTARVDSAFLLGFSDPDAFPALELTLYAWIADGGQKPAPVTCGLPETGIYASATLKWEYWDGFQWAGLTQLKDETYAFTRSGRIILKIPEGVLAPHVLPLETASLYWIRARVVKSQYEDPPILAAIRTNTMQLVQMETVVNELLGGSDGSRNQVFKLTNTPVIDGSLKLDIDQGEGWESWEERGDLLSSDGDDNHFVLNRTTGEIRFGDGVNGAIPVANANLAGANIVATEYRYGGGTRGNVAAGVLDNIRNAIEGIDSNGIKNVMASYGGRDEETLDEAKKYAPAAIRSRCRAVSSGDFEYLATQAANVKRARALPLRHPNFPGVAVPGVVSVIVVPDSETSPNPLPSEGTLRTVCEYLDARRLLTTELYVLPPTYQKVKVIADVVAAANVDTAQVQRETEAALLAYFHPLTGGEDGLGWPFGGPIHFSRVFQRIFSISGVASVRSAIVELDGEAQPICTDVTITEGNLLYSTEHEVSVSYDLGGSS